LVTIFRLLIKDQLL